MHGSSPNCCLVLLLATFWEKPIDHQSGPATTNDEIVYGDSWEHTSSERSTAPTNSSESQCQHWGNAVKNRTKSVNRIQLVRIMLFHYIINRWTLPILLIRRNTENTLEDSILLRIWVLFDDTPALNLTIVWTRPYCFRLQA